MSIIIELVMWALFAFKTIIHANLLKQIMI